MKVDIYHLYITFINGGVSILANSTFIYLVKNHSAPEFATYKYLLLIFSAFDIFYSIMHMLTLYTVQLEDGAFLVCAAPLFSISLETGRYLCAIICASFIQSIYLLCLHFVYRYLQMSRPLSLYMFKSKPYVFFLICFGICMSIYYAGVVIVFWGSKPIKDELFRDELMLHYEIDIDHIPYYAAAYYMTDSFGVKLIQWYDLLGMAMLSLQMSAVFGVMIYCGVRTYTSIKQLSALSSMKYAKAQMTIFRALLIQTAVPLIFNFTPFIIVCIGPLFGKSSYLVSNLMAIFLTVYPALDPIVLIIFIAPFRYKLSSFIYQRILGLKLKPKLSSIVAKSSKHVIPPSTNVSFIRG